ncbi:hypothetical protein OG21DRAFT_566324 [Imleria badia]|nr:hypothetical protein OG21DRAFT_566324 [Imleria badia]
MNLECTLTLYVWMTCIRWHRPGTTRTPVQHQQHTPCWRLRSSEDNQRLRKKYARRVYLPTRWVCVPRDANQVCRFRVVEPNALVIVRPLENAELFGNCSRLFVSSVVLPAQCDGLLSLPYVSMRKGSTVPRHVFTQLLSNCYDPTAGILASTARIPFQTTNLWKLRMDFQVDKPRSFEFLVLDPVAVPYRPEADSHARTHSSDRRRTRAWLRCDDPCFRSGQSIFTSSYGWIHGTFGRNPIIDYLVENGADI